MASSSAKLLQNTFGSRDDKSPTDRKTDASIQSDAQYSILMSTLYENGLILIPSKQSISKPSERATTLADSPELQKVLTDLNLTFKIIPWVRLTGGSAIEILNDKEKFNYQFYHHLGPDFKGNSLDEVLSQLKDHLKKLFPSQEKVIEPPIQVTTGEAQARTRTFSA